MTETYGSGGINWGWYLEIERVGDTTCKIIRQWRLHYYRDFDHPETLGGYRIKEDHLPKENGAWHTRNAIEVEIYANTTRTAFLKVLNPGHVFGYDGKTEQPKMDT